MKAKILLIIATITMFSCNTNDEEKVNDFKGYYKITAIISNIAFDANNDGLQSNDYLNEILSPYVINNQIYDPFYDNNSLENYAEVRPNFDSTNDAQLISFNIPSQEVGFLTENNDSGYPADYLSSFINYSYDFTETNEILIKDGNPAYTNEKGEKVISLFRIDKENFRLKVIKKAYDFVEKKWLEVEMTVNYKKQ